MTRWQTSRPASCCLMWPLSGKPGGGLLRFSNLELREALRAAGVPDETPARVGNRIRERRLALGLSQEELGRMLGYSHRTIGLLESGQWPDPRVSVALRLARALGCSVEGLFGEGEE